jgi:hypothetical protein
MSTKMIYTITADVTAVDVGAPILLNTSPHMGGQGRSAIAHCAVLPVTSTLLLEGHPVTADGQPPADDSDDWATVATFTSTALQLQEIELPYYIRWSTTVLDADGPDVKVYLEGVQ